jgi:hypothetical protein
MSKKKHNKKHNRHLTSHTSNTNTPATPSHTHPQVTTPETAHQRQYPPSDIRRHEKNTPESKKLRFANFVRNIN